MSDAHTDIMRESQYYSLMDSALYIIEKIFFTNPKDELPKLVEELKEYVASLSSVRGYWNNPPDRTQLVSLVECAKLALEEKKMMTFYASLFGLLPYLGADVRTVLKTYCRIRNKKPGEITLGELL